MRCCSPPGFSATARPQPILVNGYGLRTARGEAEERGVQVGRHDHSLRTGGEDGGVLLEHLDTDFVRVEHDDVLKKKTQMEYRAYTRHNFKSARIRLHRKPIHTMLFRPLVELQPLVILGHLEDISYDGITLRARR